MFTVLLEKRLNDRLCVEALQIRIGLARADEDDRLAGRVGHRDGGADLIVDRVELGEHNAVDGAHMLGRVSHADPASRAVVDQRLVELLDLVDGLVAYQRLADEQHQVRVVHVDQLQQTTSHSISKAQRVGSN